MMMNGAVTDPVDKHLSLYTGDRCSRMHPMQPLRDMTRAAWMMAGHMAGASVLDLDGSEGFWEVVSQKNLEGYMN